MILDEQDAKERWCAFARFAVWSKHGNSSAANRLGDDNGITLNHKYCRCIASECMSWRWQPLLADEAFAAAVSKAASELGDTSPARTKAAKHVTANRAQYGLPTKPFQGYCGLSGKPEA